jgi:ribosomal protein L37AE/L43A
MRVFTCPRCKQESLCSNGGFWLCESCGYAITLAALVAESGDGNRRRRPGP